MSFITDYELPDSESDVARISQSVLLGALADDVLLELIEIEAGIREQSALVFIPESAKLFHSLADQLRSPATLWPSVSAADTLRRLSSETVETVGERVESDTELPTWCDALAEKLRRLQEEPVGAEILASVRREFTSIAQWTLRDAASSSRMHYAIS